MMHKSWRKQPGVCSVNDATVYAMPLNIKGFIEYNYIVI